MLHVNLAFKYVAIAVMLAEANDCAERLHLPMAVPIRHQDLRQTHVGPPVFTDTGFGGRIDTDHYSFGFSDDKLRFIANIEDDRHGMSLVEYNTRLSQKKSAIGTNEAYQVAKSWLQAMDVDVARLEREKPPKVRQAFMYADIGAPQPNIKVDLPIFHVQWGENAQPGENPQARRPLKDLLAGTIDFDKTRRICTLNVDISGLGPKLLRLRQEVGYFSNRPALITNLPALMAITDEEFKSYSSAQRSNLVMRFSLIHQRALLRKANDAQRHDSSTNLSSPASPPK